MLDLEKMQKLYDFGGLMAFQCRYFNPYTFTVMFKEMTFDEAMASEQVKSLREQGFDAECTVQCVKFDGAFAKN